MARKESVGYWNVTHNRRRRSSRQYYGPLSFDVSSDSLPEDSGQHLSIHGFTERYGGASVYIHSAQLPGYTSRKEYRDGILTVEKHDGTRYVEMMSLS